VLINERPTAARVALNLSDVEFTALEAWRTSETEKLQALGKQPFSKNGTILNLPPKSITTFYGKVK
jgi:hypothetical protein